MQLSRLTATALTLLPVATAFGMGPATFCSRTTLSPASVPRLAAHHPTVAAWPEKYTGTIGAAKGPRVLHDAFAVLRGADSELLIELDVHNWPTWTTVGNDRWVENVARKDKEMPYGELCYLISGQIEFVPKDTGVGVVVNPGDFVTLPEGLVADHIVRKEITWHYYLY
jgi:hypothetical protein